jgi:hypothetical protein
MATNPSLMSKGSEMPKDRWTGRPTFATPKSSDHSIGGPAIPVNLTFSKGPQNTFAMNKRVKTVPRGGRILG